jgi:ABC-2 type transport system permease protein
MRLLKVELDRFRSRRAIVLILVAATLLTGLIAGSTAWETRPFSDAEVAAAQAQADREAKQPWVRQEIRRCEKHPERYGSPATTAEDCAAMVTPSPENFLWRPTLNLEEQLRNSGTGVAILLAALMVVAGTSFAGADWASGSMSNQLLFEPRRGRVWVAKGAAIALGAGIAAAALLAAFWAALYLVAESRGISTGATVQESIRAMTGRAAVLAGVGALGGYALTMLLRHTVGTLGLLFAYVAGGEAIIALLPVEGIGRWSLGNNILAWLDNGYTYWDNSLSCPGGGFECDKQVLMTLGESVTYLGPLLLVALLVSVWSFRRRDIP